ncbi:MAG: glycosyltransferase family 2 protein [Anaerolineales bacterium]
MSSKPLVSIITPSYNQVLYLEKTIRSVLGQNYQPIEYFVVDGASTDGSLDIIQRYSEKISWWVSEPDSGQAEAINKGLSRTTGDIIGWLNSDDIYLPGAIQQAVEILSIQPQLGLVYSDAITIDADGTPLNFLEFGDWQLLDLISFRIICQPAVFFRRETLEKAGLLDPDYHYLLDHNLWIRMAREMPIQHARPEYKQVSTGNGNRYKGLWAAARHHPGAKNVAQSGAFSSEILKLLDWMRSQPDLSEIIENNSKKVFGGAYRLHARYLLDGGQPREALNSYFKAFRYDQRYTLKHLNRILFSIAALIIGEKSAGKLKRLKDTTKPLDYGFEEILDWS